ncbi:MAG: cation:dicarboxylase symporter family transporter, partial [Peptococcaceae bacterium]|nr:cation:dicarboxylase symporter family transporter [Peptococcaceae bacterium]
MIQQFTLTNEHIDRISEIVEGFLAEAELEQKNILRTRFAIEETLLNYQETLGTNGTVKVNCVKRFGRIRVELSVPGNRFDPFDTGAEDDSEVMRGILAGMGIAPSWNYKNGVNLVVFTPQKKQRSQMVTLALSIVLALAVGGLCYLLPDGVRLFLNNSLITPLFNTFMGFLSAIAGPMIFLSVAWGIYSIGDTATFGKIGKRMITRFLMMSLVVTVVSAVAMLPFFSLSMGGAASFDFSELLNMVLDIIPDNLFTPFTEGNPMQIIFVAVLLGVAMLVMGSKTAAVASFVEQANYLIQLIMGVVSSLIPFFVFGSILNMILSDNFSALVESYKLIPLMIL